MTLPLPAAGDLVRGRLQLGDFELTVLTDGPCRFDGGAMFGVVPKVLWERRMPADAQNRVELGLNCLLVRTGRETVLIETGFGPKLDERTRGFYAAEARLMDSFAAAGVHPDEVELVVNTHLHWDHCGWNTRLGADGVVAPTFRRARYLVHRGEVEHGRRQLERDGVSYVAANYEPLLSSGQMRLLDVPAGPEQELMPGISVELYPGHTAQMMVVHFRSGGQHACFVSDLIPTAAHLAPSWVMGFDLDPLSTIEGKKRLLRSAVEERSLLIFPHDHMRPWSYVREERGRPVLTEVQTEV